MQEVMQCLNISALDSMEHTSHASATQKRWHRIAIATR